MRFSEIRSEIRRSPKFGSPEKVGIANRAVDFAEEWVNLTSYSHADQTAASKKQKRVECAQYVKEQLYNARDTEVGFIGGLIGAVLFQLLVSIIVKFIMDRFFN